MIVSIEPEKQTDSRGLKCPGCGGNDFYVKKTRDGRGAIKRVRICKGCGRRVPTKETIVGQPPEE